MNKKTFIKTQLNKEQKRRLKSNLPLGLTIAQAMSAFEQEKHILQQPIAKNIIPINKLIEVCEMLEDITGRRLDLLSQFAKLKQDAIYLDLCNFFSERCYHLVKKRLYNS